jgi:CRP/FNR family transcriptional regulator, cyclic AMP receptor protein
MNFGKGGLVMERTMNPGEGPNAFLSAGKQAPFTIEQASLPYDTIQLKEGEILFREGEVPQGLYYIHSGCVKMVVNRQQSRGRTTSPEYVTKLVSPGEYFGYKALIRNGPSSATAKAVKASTVWQYSRDSVLSALNNSSPLVKLLLQQAVGDIENYETTSQLHYLASVQERIAYQLVVLSEKFGVQTPDGVSLNLRLTRNEFAQLASTINESLSRHLTEFKNEGLIEINGKEIIIKDKIGLMKRSGNFKI